MTWIVTATNKQGCLIMQTKAMLILALLCTSTSINSYANLNGCVDTSDSEKKTVVYFVNGILTISMELVVPEHKKPRTIEIGTVKKSKNKKFLAE